jgi:hypothetical protein
VILSSADVPRLVADARRRYDDVAARLDADAPAAATLRLESARLARFERETPPPDVPDAALEEIATAAAYVPRLEELTRVSPHDTERVSELLQLAFVFRWSLEKLESAVPEDPLRRIVAI